MIIVTKSVLALASATLIATAGLVAPVAAQQPPAAGSTPPQAAPAQPGPAMGGQMKQRGGEHGRMGQGTAGQGTAGQGTAGQGTMGPGTMGPGTMGPGTMGSGMMGPGMMGRGIMQMMMGSGAGHTEGRLAFIKAELKVTDAQMPQWNAFADAVRANAAAMADMRGLMMSQHASGITLPERLAAEDKALSAHYAAFKKTTEALNNLYGVLNPEQKKMADGIIVGPMGLPMGMM